jgi:hypothetical protein
MYLNTGTRDYIFNIGKHLLRHIEDNPFEMYDACSYMHLNMYVHTYVAINVFINVYVITEKDEKFEGI